MSIRKTQSEIPCIGPSNFTRSGNYGHVTVRIPRVYPMVIVTTTTCLPAVSPVHITRQLVAVTNNTAKNCGFSLDVTGLEWPRGFQEVKVPRLHDNGTGWW